MSYLYGPVEILIKVKGHIALIFPIFLVKKYEKWFSAMRQLYPHSCLDGIIDNEFSTDNTKIFLDNMNEDTYPKFLKHVVEVITKRKKYLDGF